MNPELQRMLDALATATDTAGREYTSSTYLWVADEDFVGWRTDPREKRMDLVADKREYKPGEVARILVQSISMQPNLKEGDLVLVNRLVYHFSEPKRGEVIVFKNPVNPEDVPYIKRIIGLPGDTVSIEQGRVYIDGQLLSEPYLQTTTLRGGEYTIMEGELFVMGDNRNNSSDSRAWGNVPVDLIIGRAEAIYWPPQDWQLVNQRMNFINLQILQPNLCRGKNQDI